MSEGAVNLSHKDLRSLDIPLTHTQVTLTKQMCCHGNPLRGLSPASGIAKEQAQLSVCGNGACKSWNMEQSSRTLKWKGLWPFPQGSCFDIVARPHAHLSCTTLIAWKANIRARDFSYSSLSRTHNCTTGNALWSQVEKEEKKNERFMTPGPQAMPVRLF